MHKVPIDDLYVEPTFAARSPWTSAEDGEQSLSGFLASAHRDVVLGHPGCGKSTLAGKLCYDLSLVLFRSALRRETPHPFPCSAQGLYGAGKQEGKYSILEYLALISKTKYQISPPNGAFEYLLLNGRLLVIFDGLDELLDSSYRLEVSGDIEAFWRALPIGAGPGYFTRSRLTNKLRWLQSGFRSRYWPHLARLDYGVHEKMVCRKRGPN